MKSIKEMLEEQQRLVELRALSRDEYSKLPHDEWGWGSIEEFDLLWSTSNASFELLAWAKKARAKLKSAWENCGCDADNVSPACETCEDIEDLLLELPDDTSTPVEKEEGKCRLD